MTEQIKYIPARLKSAVKGGYVTSAEDIDAGDGKSQQQVNNEIDNTLALHQSEISGLNSQNYVTVSTYASLPATGEADTIYRVSFYDGTQVDATKYAEYAWNGSTYVLLDVKSAISEVFDISKYKAVGGTLATFADLSVALNNGNNVPVGIRKGGMSVKFIQGSAQSSDNKYVQYRLMSNEFSTTESDWEGVDAEPTAGSNNLVKSDGVVKYIRKTSAKIAQYDAGRIATGSVGDTLTMDVLDNHPWNHLVVPVVKGNIVCIYGFGTNQSRLYAIVDNSYEVLAIHPYINKNGYPIDVEITQDDAAYIIINTFDDGTLDYGFKLYDSAEEFLRLRSFSSSFGSEAAAAIYKPSIEFLNVNTTTNICTVKVRGYFVSLFEMISAGDTDAAHSVSFDNCSYAYSMLIMRVKRSVTDNVVSAELDVINLMTNQEDQQAHFFNGKAENNNPMQRIIVLAFMRYGKVYWRCAVNEGITETKINEAIGQYVNPLSTGTETWQVVANEAHSMNLPRTIKKGEIFDIHFELSGTNAESLYFVIFNSSYQTNGFRIDVNRQYNKGKVLRCKAPADLSNIRFNSPSGSNATFTASVVIRPDLSSTEFVVDKNGKGDFASLYDALINIADIYHNGNNYSNIHQDILVKVGEYSSPELDVNAGGNYYLKDRYRNLTIKGESVAQCVIKNTNGYYDYTLGKDNPCLRINGNVEIYNLTFKALSTNYDSQLGNYCRSYCVHIDSPATINNAEDSMIYIHDCIMVNDHFACIGFGVNPKQAVLIESCDLTSTILSTQQPQSYGVIHGHDRPGDGRELLQLVSNIIRNTDASLALSINHAGADRGIECEFAYNTSNVGNVDISSKNVILPSSFGNKIAAMNYQ